MKDIWNQLAIIFGVMMCAFILGMFLKLNYFTIFIGVLVVTILVVLILAFIFDKAKDAQPLPITDLRKVEEVERCDNHVLWELYHKETGRCVHSTIYVLMSPDEKHYMEWLELQATKFLILKDGVPGQETKASD